MLLYLAPMEEVTGYIFRNTIEKHFGGIDRYYTPFICPNQNKILKTRDGREIIPEHNAGLDVIPQILTNNAEHLVELVTFLYELGYNEINLNCGCPSGTVVKKKRGSGLLDDTELLDELLDGYYSSDIASKVKMSVKTRVGYDTEEDFVEVIKIYNKYPLTELIIHPRIQKDLYQGQIRMNMFEYGTVNANMPVCYNGDIFTAKHYTELMDNNEFIGDVKAVMIGRGAVANPGLFREIKNGRKMTIDELISFHDDLFETYASEYSEKDALFKLKEVWAYMQKDFDGIEKSLKNMKKSQNRAEYLAACREIWRGEYLLDG